MCPWEEATLCLISLDLFYVGHHKRGADFTLIKEIEIEHCIWNSSDVVIQKAAEIFGLDWDLWILIGAVWEGAIKGFVVVSRYICTPWLYTLLRKLLYTVPVRYR